MLALMRSGGGAACAEVPLEIELLLLSLPLDDDFWDDICKEYPID